MIDELDRCVTALLAIVFTLGLRLWFLIRQVEDLQDDVTELRKGKR